MKVVSVNCQIGILSKQNERNFRANRSFEDQRIFSIYMNADAAENIEHCKKTPQPVLDVESVIVMFNLGVACMLSIHTDKASEKAICLMATAQQLLQSIIIGQANIFVALELLQPESIMLCTMIDVFHGKDARRLPFIHHLLQVFETVSQLTRNRADMWRRTCFRTHLKTQSQHFSATRLEKVNETKK